MDKTKENLEFLAREVLQNLPEYACSPLECIDWNYEECIYEFIEHDYDEDKEKKHTLTLSKAVKGLKTLIEKIQKGELHYYGVETIPLMHKASKNALLDFACDFDQCVVDDLVQLSLLGEVIYG